MEGSTEKSKFITDNANNVNADINTHVQRLKEVTG